MKRWKLAGLTLLFWVVLCFGVNAYEDPLKYEVKKDGSLRVTGIEDDATRADIPESINGRKVTEIEPEAFYSHFFLEEIYIPATVDYIGEYAFSYDYALQKIEVDPQNPCYSSQDGVLFDKEKTILYNYPCDRSGTTYVVPKTVKKLYCTSFARAKNLDKVYLPNKNTGWMTFTFYGDEGLELYYKRGGLSERYLETYQDYFTEWGIFPKAYEEQGDNEAPVVSTAYKITYVLNKGTNHKENPSVYRAQNIRLNKPKRKGYQFEGWYLDKGFRNKVTEVRAAWKKDVILYAGWSKVSVKKAPAPKLSNSSKGKLNVQFRAVKGAKGYQLIYSTDKKFKKGKKTVFTSKQKVVLPRLKKGKTYYVKLRAYRVDSTGQKVFGKYGPVRKLKIKK